MTQLRERVLELASQGKRDTAIVNALKPSHPDLTRHRVRVILGAEGSEPLQYVGPEPVIRGEWLAETGLDLPPGLPFERWLAVGDHLKRLEKGVQFWIGDWINYGESEYGERYAQAIEETGYTHGALRNMAWVAREIPPSSRDDNLTFSHHRILAGVEPEKRDEYRQALKETPMSVGELTGRVKAKEPKGTMLYLPLEQIKELKQLALNAPVDEQEAYMKRWDDRL